MSKRQTFDELCAMAHAICDRYEQAALPVYIGHLGKQDSEYDNILAENAEYVHVPNFPLDTVRGWAYRLYQYRSKS